MTVTRLPIPKRELEGYSLNARHWWREVNEAYDFTATELVVVREILRGITRLDKLNADMADQPSTVKNRGGESVVHPLLTETRMLSQSVTKLLGTLHLPNADDDDVKKPAPQKRSKVRSMAIVSGM